MAIQTNEIYDKIEFPSKDGLTITADLYSAKTPKGFILLCHRSHCNRAEYRETAPRLLALGYSCLAIDQRSGMKIFGETNETANRAKAAGLATGYWDAMVDIEAGVDYGYSQNSDQPIIVLGSSYSGSLALLCAVRNTKIGTVLAFSPGEFLKNTSVQKELRELKKPIFVTSNKAEVAEVTEVVRLLEKKYLTQHIPISDGFHGSKMLWKSVSGSEEYWVALQAYLKKVVAN
jgi:alpha-beta hydrolase superfamily lysophospholipase